MNFKGEIKSYILSDDSRINYFLDLLLDYDYEIYKNNFYGLIPNLLRGVFHKRKDIQAKNDITPWTKSEIKEQLFSRYDKIGVKIYRKMMKTFKILLS